MLEALGGMLGHTEEEVNEKKNLIFSNQLSDSVDLRVCQWDPVQFVWLTTITGAGQENGRAQP